MFGHRVLTGFQVHGNICGELTFGGRTKHMEINHALALVHFLVPSSVSSTSERPYGP